MSGNAGGSKVGEMYVELAARAQPFNAAIDAAGNRFGAFSASIKSMAAGVAAAALGGSLVAGFYKAIKSASDLNETINKVGVIFGPQAKIVTAAADEMAAKYGVVKTEFMDASAEIGNLLQGMGGQSEKAAAETSVALTKLAADASSIFNKSFGDSKAKIASALRGQSEPISEFGIDLQEAAVKAEAARMGIARFGAELTTQQKVTARTSLLTKGLQVAQGDLAATSGGFANASRAAWGRIENTLATFGAALLPIVENALAGFNRMMTGVQAFADRAGPYITAFTDKLTEVASYAAWMAGQVLDALGSLVSSAAAYWSEAITQTDTYKATMAGLVTTWEWVRDTGKGIWDGIGVVFRNFSNILLETSLRVQMYGEMIVEAFRFVGRAAETIAVYVARNWKELLTDAFNAVLSALTNLGKNFMDFGAALAHWFESGFTDFQFNFTPLLSGFKATVEQMPAIAGPQFDAVRSKYQGMLDQIQEAEVKTETKRLDGLAKAPDAKKAADAKRPKRAQTAMEGKGEAKAEFIGLAELSKKLQLDVSSKGSQFKKLEDIGERTAAATELVAQNTGALRNGVPAKAT